MLQTRFEYYGDLSDLDRAVELARAAAGLVETDPIAHAGYLSNLALALQIRFEHTGEVANITEAVELGQAALAALAPDHPERPGFQSNLGFARHARYERLAIAADLDEAIAQRLMPVLAWRGLHRQDTERLLTGEADLISDAVAWAVDPGAAVELVETGRSVLWSQLLDHRRDLTALRRIAPHLAAGVERLCAALTVPPGTPFAVALEYRR